MVVGCRRVAAWTALCACTCLGASRWTLTRCGELGELSTFDLEPAASRELDPDAVGAWSVGRDDAERDPDDLVDA
jgi:hypothetical protein